MTKDSDTKSAEATSPAVALAKEKQTERGEFIVERHGVRARLVGISKAIATEAKMRIKDPPVPTYYNEDKEREEENPSHPDYIKALEECNTKRGAAIIDSAAMFGIELLDPLPDDDGWLKRLRFMEKRGHIDLSGYDLEDEIDCEFLFKRFIFWRDGDYTIILQKANLAPEAIRAAEDSFRG